MARLGLVRQVTQEHRPTLVFDDPFVTFDDVRARRAAELLRDLAGDFQVLYLTTSDRYDSVADSVLELPGPTLRDEFVEAPVEVAPVVAAAVGSSFATPVEESPAAISVASVDDGRLQRRSATESRHVADRRPVADRGRVVDRAAWFAESASRCGSSRQFGRRRSGGGRCAGTLAAGCAVRAGRAPGGRLAPEDAATGSPPRTRSEPPEDALPPERRSAARKTLCRRRSWPCPGGQLVHCTRASRSEPPCACGGSLARPGHGSASSSDRTRHPTARVVALGIRGAPRSVVDGARAGLAGRHRC